jgi:hypothetical protein
MDDIAILNNNLYRIGDIIKSNIPEIEHEIMNNPKYIGSFIYNFIRQVKIKKAFHKHERLNIATDIIKFMLRINNVHYTTDDTIVIHLRLGDIMNIKEHFFEKEEYQTNICNRLPELHKLLVDIKKHDKPNIVIVTAFHHNLYGKIRNDSTKIFPITQNNDTSIEFLTQFLSQIPKKYNVTIRSSTNIDEDFLYLCSAKNLLLSSNGSGFGNCAQYINQLIKTGKYLPVPRKNRRNPTFGMKLL